MHLWWNWGHHSPSSFPISFSPRLAFFSEAATVSKGLLPPPSSFLFYPHPLSLHWGHHSRRQEDRGGSPLPHPPHFLVQVTFFIIRRGHLLLLLAPLPHLRKRKEIRVLFLGMRCLKIFTEISLSLQTRPTRLLLSLSPPSLSEMEVLFFCWRQRPKFFFFFFLFLCCATWEMKQAVKFSLRWKEREKFFFSLLLLKMFSEQHPSNFWGRKGKKKSLVKH